MVLERRAVQLGLPPTSMADILTTNCGMLEQFDGTWYADVALAEIGDHEMLCFLSDFPRWL